MKRTIASLLLAATCLTLACASEPADDGLASSPQPFAIASPIRGLAVTVSDDETMLTYGTDVLRLYPPAAPRPADLAAGFDVLDVWPVEADARGPVQLRCGGKAGQVCTSNCGSISCTGGPPPPVIGQYATNPNKLAVRKSGLAFPRGAGPITVGGAPAILVLGRGPRDSLDTLSRDAWTWVQGQERELALHVYNVVDPAGAHPLHNTVIAIAVPVAD